MRCLSCGAEMHVAQVTHDENMAAIGFERQTFKCPRCLRTRGRWEFVGDQARAHLLAANVMDTPAPDAKPYSEPDSWTRAIETLRKRQAALGPQRPPAAAAPHVPSSFERKERYIAGRPLTAIAEALGRLGQANGAVALRKLEALDRSRRRANLEPGTSTTLGAGSPPASLSPVQSSEAAE